MTESDNAVKSQLPQVSVIVSARNDADTLKDCLVSLLRTEYPPAGRQVIVVDNGSSDGTARIIKSFPVLYLWEPRRGVCYARNRGIEASRGEILAFTDPDCVVGTGWLRELVCCFNEDAVGAVAGAIVPYPPSTLAELYAARRRSHSQERPMSHPDRPFAMTPNLAFRREVFSRIGLFDTRFPGGGWEDADLCWRLRRQTSLDLRYAPRAVVFHRYRSTARDFLVQQYRYGYGLSLLYRKHAHELRWGWKERARAYQELLLSAKAVVTAAALYVVHQYEPAALGLRYFDFVRQVGQRSGFTVAALFRS